MDEGGGSITISNRFYVIENDVPHPHPAVAFGLSILNSDPIKLFSNRIVDPSKNGIDMSSVKTIFSNVKSFWFFLSVSSSLY